MHEYTVVSELVTGLLPRLENVEGRVLSVHLKKGELRILSDASLTSAFEILRAGTRLSEATLEVETIPASVRCRACGYAGPTTHLRDEAFHMAIPILTCPRCRGEVEVTSGRELSVDSVRVCAPAESQRQAETGREGPCPPSGDG